MTGQYVSDNQPVSPRNYATPERREVNRRAVTKFNATKPERRALHRERERCRRAGITVEQLHAARIRQGGKCALFAICGRVLVVGRGDGRSPNGEHIDHDHVTGRFRGLLCRECNHGLGKLGDQPRTIRLALDYVSSPPDLS